MRTLTQSLTELVSYAFQDCGYDGSFGIVSLSDRLDLCQFQCNGAFSGAKKYKKPPMVIAGEVWNILKGNEIFEIIEVVAPGFINITLKDDFLIENGQVLADDPYFGIYQIEKNETILLDYGGANVAKSLHIGHLRSAIIGEALKNLFRAAGYTVLGDAHLGDWGLPIGLVIAELEEQKLEQFTSETLNEIYPAASLKSKDDEDFKRKAKQITADLQKGDMNYLSIWKKIVSISIESIKREYDSLHVNFDLWYGESDSDRYIPSLLEILDRSGLLHESEGAMVVDVVEPNDNMPMPPVIIKKTDGSSNYATTDLATILQRQHDYAPSKIWYVVDNRQTLHFTQIFRCAKKARIIPENTELLHLGFGTMNAPDGKPFKTRDGGVMPLAEFIGKAKDCTFEKMISFVGSDAEKHVTSDKLAIAAIKFGDLVNHRSGNYIFDSDKFLSFEGKTGVYLLYTITRIHSILRKCGISVDAKAHLTNLYNDSDRDLLFAILQSTDAYIRAINDKAPNFICESAYGVASAFSRFYNENHILHETDLQKKDAWINLCLLTKSILMRQLDILGIEAVEIM